MWECHYMFFCVYYKTETYKCNAYYKYDLTVCYLWPNSKAKQYVWPGNFNGSYSDSECDCVWFCLSIILLTSLFGMFLWRIWILANMTAAISKENTKFIRIFISISFKSDLIQIEIKSNKKSLLIFQNVSSKLPPAIFDDEMMN